MGSTKFNFLSLFLGLVIIYTQALWLPNLQIGPAITLILGLAGVHNARRGSFYFANKKTQEVRYAKAD